MDTELLISAVEEQRNIWDVSNEDYKNRDARQKSWEGIAAVAIPNFQSLLEKEKEQTVVKLQKRWKTIRDAFIRCRSKGKHLKSGSSAAKKSKYIYYDNLKFLENNIDLNRTETNFTDNVLEEDTQNLDTTTKNHEESDKENIEEEVEVERLHTKKKRRRNQNGIEHSLINFLQKAENQIDCDDKLILDSLLPTLRNFNTVQKLQFRSQVLNVMIAIQKQGSMPTPMFPPPTPYDVSGSSANAFHQPIRPSQIQESLAIERDDGEGSLMNLSFIDL